MRGRPKGAMSGFERVRAAILFEETDRVPLDICGTVMTGLARPLAERLMAAIGEDCALVDAELDLAEPPRRVLDRLGVDTARLGQAAGDDGPGGPGRGRAEGERTVRSLSRAAPAGLFPVADLGLPGLMGMAAGCRGLESFLADLALDEAAAGRALDLALERKLALWEEAAAGLAAAHSAGGPSGGPGGGPGGGLGGAQVDAAGPTLVAAKADDYGGEGALLVSPEKLRRLVFPRLAVLVSRVKRLFPGSMLFFHSCGAIGEIVPDLIDCGVDILNPGSPSARGMDMARLKRDFGRDLVLWGPGLGAGEIRGLSPADAAARTRRFLDAMAAGGGFVFAPAQDLPSDFPAEILLATIGAAAGPPISPRA